MQQKVKPEQKSFQRDSEAPVPYSWLDLEPRTLAAFLPSTHRRLRADIVQVRNVCKLGKIEKWKQNPRENDEETNIKEIGEKKKETFAGMATCRLATLAFVEVPGTSLRRKGTNTAFRNCSPSPQQAHEDTQRHLFSTTRKSWEQQIRRGRRRKTLTLNPKTSN